VIDIRRATASATAPRTGRLIARLALLLLLIPPAGAAALTAEEQEDIRAHDRIAASVVQILVRGVSVDMKAGRQHLVRLTGSGFAVAPGRVVTNYHVIEDARRIRVVLQDGHMVDAAIVGTAPGYDLALLKVDVDAEHLPPAPLGTSGHLRVAQRVMAVSNPMGLDHSVSVGIISGLNRELRSLEIGPRLIQFDAAINPGQSGGPLVDSDGEVIGVTTAKVAAAEAIGFAIPIDLVRRTLPDLVRMGHPFRPSVGFVATPVTPDIARLFELPASHGMLVTKVKPGSPAAAAGLTAGHRIVTLAATDLVLGGDIITAANGEPIFSPADLADLLLRSRPGDRITLTVVHGDGSREVTLVVPKMHH